MKLFYFEFPGRYLGGYAIVAALTKEEAGELLNAKLREESLEPLTPEDIGRVRRLRALCKGVVEFYDGDY